MLNYQRVPSGKQILNMAIEIYLIFLSNGQFGHHITVNMVIFDIDEFESCFLGGNTIL